MFQSNMNYITAINNLRSTMSENPQHNRHILLIAQCIQDAFAASNLQYDMELTELRQTIKSLEERVARLESIIQTLEKKTPSPTAPLPVDIFITPRSLKKAKSAIQRYLN